MKNLMQAHSLAIAAPQTAEDNRRYDGLYPEGNESFMDSVNHFGGIGASVGNEERRS